MKTRKAVMVGILALTPFACDSYPEVVNEPVPPEEPAQVGGFSNGDDVVFGGFGPRTGGRGAAGRATGGAETGGTRGARNTGGADETGGTGTGGRRGTGGTETTTGGRGRG